ncbi:AhpC/TSA family protein [Gilliamella sp. B14384H2]|uniref:peroxiredoxin-like family protein n=1 Tax=unclassified Gilliamella TaxID=2685620 RepID=UPI0018DE760E|nr:MULTISPECIES: peroxiredoxin-like family protein [unclassified Gilliamella]MBI0038639.1 AhpC/TSA family protein [Gilliamella sp. B14384G10]MBI0040932.1 AhpC/TSA family protein [Gilliamella sp. B14384G7]MBI0052619.1 AhpC/TSA family protein [Gilliamella sp. B14384G13]MBI0054914.1 AhpC/TSA family protein [Gilliamella sp. B14384H2]
MKLIEDLQRLRRDLITQLPQDVQNILDNSLADMLSEKLDSDSLQCGDIAPDFSLISTDNQEINLYKLLETQPVIISFFRGSWCPFCVKELEHFQNNLELIQQVKNMHFIAISPQKASISAQLKQEKSMSITILSDIKNNIANKFGLVFTLPEKVRELYNSLGANLLDFNGDDSYTLPIPATYLIGQDKKIYFAYVNANYMERADISELINVLN